MNKNLARPILRSLLFFVLFFPLSNKVFGVDGEPTQPLNYCPEGKIKIVEGIALPCDSTESLAGLILQISIWIAASIATILVIGGGYVVMTSAGDPGRLKRGREIITNALIGLVLITTSGFILRFMGKLIGLK